MTWCARRVENLARLCSHVATTARRGTSDGCRARPLDAVDVRVDQTTEALHKGAGTALTTHSADRPSSVSRRHHGRRGRAHHLDRGSECAQRGGDHSPLRGAEASDQRLEPVELEPGLFSGPGFARSTISMSAADDQTRLLSARKYRKQGYEVALTKEVERVGSHDHVRAIHLLPGVAIDALPAGCAARSATRQRPCEHRRRRARTSHSRLRSSRPCRCGVCRAARRAESRGSGPGREYLTFRG
jgi:hypothetical protein